MRTRSRVLRYAGVLLLGCFVIVILTFCAYSTSPGFVQNIRSSTSDIRIETSRAPDTRIAIHDAFRSASVVFIVRAHAGYAAELLSFLWMMRSQAKEDSIAVLVVPTEYDSISALKQTLHAHWLENSKVAVNVLDLPLRFYETHCCHLVSLCTEEWRNVKLADGWPAAALDRYCNINTPLHYYVTDAALRHALSSCKNCIGVVITNADNFYAPAYVSENIKLLSAGADVVLTDMVHRGSAIAVRPESGYMDLGAVMFNTAFLKSSSMNFVSSLPRPTEPQHWHDADFWLVQRLLEKGAQLQYVRKYLFTHN